MSGRGQEYNFKVEEGNNGSNLLIDFEIEEEEETPEEAKKTTKLVSAFCVKISQENTFALAKFNLIFSEILAQLPTKTREKKVEDHHRVRVGKEIGEEDLTSIIQKYKELKGWYEDKEKREEIISEICATDQEVRDLTEEDVQHSPYLLEDLTQIVFRAKEAVEKENYEPEKPKKKKEEKKRRLKTLEEEIKELERQKQELDRKLSDPSLNPAKKHSYEEDEKEIRRQLLERRARLDSLQRELKNTDNDKSNLALGLGIFAAVIAVICLVILLVRPSRRNQY
ncbi:1146_t:CDS:2 [Funneliformis geosporum]|nr:1146_t:CDS:2 [Funneliformis geosporum]